MGLAVTSHQEGVLASASFDGVSVGSVSASEPPGPQPASEFSGIGFLGDSETELYYLVTGIESRTILPEPTENMRYSTLVGKALGVKTVNYGRGGQTTAVFLQDSIMEEWKAGKHTYSPLQDD